jgi:class 3 adenylate cyclase
MRAGGLFSPNTPPVTHVKQMIRFALEVLQVRDCVNEQLGPFLSVKIGIRSGGHILASVLGTKRSTFGIIGDAINVAARLQRTISRQRSRSQRAPRLLLLSWISQ